MEESLNSKGNLWDSMVGALDLKGTNPKQLSPLVLAYIGDSVYDLVIKTYLIDRRGNMQVNKLNKMSSGIVKAETQSKCVEILEGMFTEEEEAVYKRGRNAKSYTSAKNATITDYRRATGFEALMGYLYLSGQTDRMCQLIKTALQEIGELK